MLGEAAAAISGSRGCPTAVIAATLPTMTPSCSARVHHPSKSLASLRLPGLAHQIVGRGISAAHQQRQQFVVGPAPEQRPDQRLDQTCGAVAGPQIGPRLEFMRLRHVPGGEIGRFVGVASQMQPEGRLRRTLRKFEIGGRIVAGVHADHHELVDSAGIEIVHQVGKRARLRARQAFWSISI